MAQQKPPTQVSPVRDANFWARMLKQLRLVWLLLRDQQVPFWVKSIPALSVVYVISPVDFIPDPLVGLGQLDDIGIILLGIALFIKMCPPNLVEYYQNMLEYGSESQNHPTDAVDTTYRVLDEDQDRLVDHE